ncbi:MAG: glycosyltransferase family 4 protein [Deltaproteobacteria bacterium]|nr:glycosyltransferase family 4 protein [Deltaproteobacteria bacterium]
MRKLAYLFPTFPVFHQTFVLWEVLGLRRNGVDPLLFSLRPAAARQQPEGEAIKADVTYLPNLFSSEVWRANWKILRSNPLLYFQLYTAVVAAWRTGAVPPKQPDSAMMPVALYDRLRGWYNRQPLLYLLKSLRLVPTAVELAERLQAAGVEHLHVHWATYPATVAFVINRLTSLPFSVSAHAYDIYMVSRMLPAKIDAAKFFLTCAKTNANYLSRLAGERLGSKVQVSYHGVDLRRFAPRVVTDRSDGVLKIVSCGQLERYKGFHTLIEACARVRAQGIDLECRIVGEGPRRAQLTEQIESLGLNGIVHLLGARPHAELVELLRQADIFVLASELAGKAGRRDVIANVIVEAMAVGLPAVATAIPGAEELVESGTTGYLVPANVVEPVVDAVLKLAKDPDERLRLGAAARQRVERDFDSNKNVVELAALFTAATGTAIGSNPPTVR